VKELTLLEPKYIKFINLLKNDLNIKKEDNSKILYIKLPDKAIVRNCGKLEFT